MGKRILGQSLTQTDIPSLAPVGDVGLDMTLFLEASRPRWWLMTVTVTVAPAFLYVWGALPSGVPDDLTDDVWGFHCDELGVLPLPNILQIGVYHFIVDGLGLYSQVYFQKSAGTVDVMISEILDGGRGN